MKVVRLTTGDEVICNVVETENTIKISDALKYPPAALTTPINPNFIVA